MVVPLIILAFLSLVGGWIGVPQALGGSDHIDHFLAPVFSAYAPVAASAENAAAQTTPEHEDRAAELTLTGISVLVALIGLLAA